MKDLNIMKFELRDLEGLNSEELIEMYNKLINKGNELDDKMHKILGLKDYSNRIDELSILAKEIDKINNQIRKIVLHSKLERY